MVHPTLGRRMSGVCLAIVGLATAGCAVHTGEENTDIHVPAVLVPVVFWRIPESIGCWFKMGPDDLVVTTSRHVIRLHRGRVVWNRRLRRVKWLSALAGRDPLWYSTNAPIRACFASDDVILTVRRTRDRVWGEQDVVLTAIAADTGCVLAQTSHHVAGGKRSVVATIRTRRHRILIAEWVDFLLPASDGYWWGLSPGIIAYRKYGSTEPPARIKL